MLVTTLSPVYAVILRGWQAEDVVTFSFILRYCALRCKLGNQLCYVLGRTRAHQWCHWDMLITAIILQSFANCKCNHILLLNDARHFLQSLLHSSLAWTPHQRRGALLVDAGYCSLASLRINLVTFFADIKHTWHSYANVYFEVITVSFATVIIIGTSLLLGLCACLCKKPTPLLTFLSCFPYCRKQQLSGYFGHHSTCCLLHWVWNWCSYLPCLYDAYWVLCSTSTPSSMNTGPNGFCILLQNILLLDWATMRLLIIGRWCIL